MLLTKYEETKKKVQQKLEEMSTVALMTDIRSSRQGLSYCCLTAHAISAESWKLKSYALETFNFNTDHTGEQISIKLTKVVNKWKSLDISCCITDNASNMLLGIERAGWNHLLCYTHTLNLVVQDAIKADPELSVQEKCKSIVSHFHRSTKSSEKLRSVQQQLHVPELKLI